MRFDANNNRYPSIWASYQLPHDSGCIVNSLDRKRLGADFWARSEISIRGVFDEETRRKPRAFAAGAVRYGI